MKYRLQDIDRRVRKLELNNNTNQYETLIVTLSSDKKHYILPNGSSMLINKFDKLFRNYNSPIIIDDFTDPNNEDD